MKIGSEAAIDGSLCTECMLCTAACASSALEVAGEEPYALISRLARVPDPVLGCAREEVRAHVKTHCLGFLSEEHLVALGVLLENGVALNLSVCGRCENSFMLDGLRRAAERVEAVGQSGGKWKLRLVEDENVLDYEEVEYGRRGFLREWGRLAKEAVVEVNGALSREQVAEPYRRKIVPARRKLLNDAVRSLSDGEGNEGLIGGILGNYYFEASRNPSCKLCFSCVGACPTGALDVREGERPDEWNPSDEAASDELLFDASLCAGCGLCEQFCLSHAMSIRRGWREGWPFGYRSVPLSAAATSS